MSNKKNTAKEKRSFSQCRKGCGACCIAPSISTPIPGMIKGKPAGVRCLCLDSENLCTLFNYPERPQVCNDFLFDTDICGDSREQALDNLSRLEQATSP